MQRSFRMRQLRLTCSSRDRADRAGGSSHSGLRWRAIGRDLALENPEDFDARKFRDAVDAFASAVRSGRNKSLVRDLGTWAENPRHSRLTSATVESLLRWTITGTTWKAAVPFAHDVWTLLFGTPVPTWKRWNDSARRYEFEDESLAPLVQQPRCSNASLSVGSKDVSGFPAPAVRVWSCLLVHASW